MKKDRLNKILKGEETYNVLHLFKQGINGCTYYRNISPLFYLKKGGVCQIQGTHQITTRNVEEKSTGKVVGFELDVTLLNWADVVVFSRFYNPEFSELIRAYAIAAKEMGKVIIYEADDDFFHIPDHNPVYREATAALDDVKFLMDIADGYTTTTERLAKVMVDYKKKPYFVLPNSVEMDAFHGAEFKKRENIRIGWAGGSTHTFDLTLIIPTMEYITAKYPNVEFVIYGSKGMQAAFEDVKCDIEWHNFTPVNEYPQKLVELDLDIGLIPLEPYEFNYNKSSVKWMEYSAAKMATIYAGIPPYSDTIKDGQTGLEVKDVTNPVAWAQAIEKLINDVELRCRLASNAYSEVRDKYNIKNNYRMWDKAYKFFLKRKGGE